MTNSTSAVVGVAILMRLSLSIESTQTTFMALLVRLIVPQLASLSFLYLIVFLPTIALPWGKHETRINYLSLVDYKAERVQFVFKTTTNILRLSTIVIRTLSNHSGLQSAYIKLFPFFIFILAASDCFRS